MPISLAFLGSALVVIVTPGPDLALLTGILVRTRRRAPALSAAAGMTSAGAGYAVLAIIGVADLIAHRPGLLTGLRVGGAMLLAGYGLLALGSLARREQPADTPTLSTRPAFAAGFLSTAANPKVGLFLLAFLPQFLPADRPSATAMALLAMVYLGLVALWLGFYIVLAHRVAWLLAGAHAARVLQAVTGCVLVGLAARLALG